LIPSRQAQTPRPCPPSRPPALDLARSAGALAPADLRDVRPATFGEVLAGRHPGRAGSAELTVYAPVGLPWQDLAPSGSPTRQRPRMAAAWPWTCWP